MVQLGWEDTLNRLLAESPQLGRRPGRRRSRPSGIEPGMRRAIIPMSRYRPEYVRQRDRRRHCRSPSRGSASDIQSQTRATFAKAQAELTAAQRNVERGAIGPATAIGIGFEQYCHGTFDRLKNTTTTFLPNAQESLKLVSSGYRQGEFSYLVLLTAQRTYFQTNLAYLDALRDLRTACVAIEGNLLGDNLQAVEIPERSAE